MFCNPPQALASVSGFCDLVIWRHTFSVFWDDIVLPNMNKYIHNIDNSCICVQSNGKKQTESHAEQTKQKKKKNEAEQKTNKQK